MDVFMFSEVEFLYMKQTSNQVLIVLDICCLFIFLSVCVGYGSQESNSLVAFDLQLFYMGNEG